jgi:hypothetical protein
MIPFTSFWKPINYIADMTHISVTVNYGKGRNLQNFFFQILAISVCQNIDMNTLDYRVKGNLSNPGVDHVRHFLHNQHLRNIFQEIRGHKPKGISISSAIPSIPINVKAIAVTTGTVPHPKSLTSAIGSANRYNVTHCFK